MLNHDRRTGSAPQFWHVQSDELCYLQGDVVFLESGMCAQTRQHKLARQVLACTNWNKLRVGTTCGDETYNLVKEHNPLATALKVLAA